MSIYLLNRIKLKWKETNQLKWKAGQMCTEMPDTGRCLTSVSPCFEAALDQQKLPSEMEKLALVLGWADSSRCWQYV